MEIDGKLEMYGGCVMEIDGKLEMRGGMVWRFYGDLTQIYGNLRGYWGYGECFRCFGMLWCGL